MTDYSDTFSLTIKRWSSYHDVYLHELDCLVDVFLELLARLLVLLLQVAEVTLKEYMTFQKS